MNYLIRLRLPDRPGALGAVASRIGSVGADVVSIEILQRDRGVVVDELGVGLAGEHLIRLLRDEILEVDGVTIESMRPLEGPVPDRYAELLDVATALFTQTSESALLDQLVLRVRRSLAATFAAVLDEPVRSVLTAEGDVPGSEQLVGMARVARGRPVGAASEEEGGEPMPDEAPTVAAAPIGPAGPILVVGRRDPLLRERERQWISIMAEVAGHRSRELS